MSQLFNLIRTDGTILTASFSYKSIEGITYQSPTSFIFDVQYGNFPVTLSLTDRLYKVETSNNCWQMQVTQSNLSLVSGSNITASFMSSVSCSYANNDYTTVGTASITITPQRPYRADKTDWQNISNVLYNGSLVSLSSYRTTLNNSGATVLSLIPNLVYKIEVAGNYKTSCEYILPTGSLHNVGDITVVESANPNLY